MGFGSPIHWILVLLVIVLLFGAGRISGVMGDLGKGIKSFKKGLNEEDGTSSDAPAAPAPAPAPQARITDERPTEQRTTTTTTDADRS